MQPNEPTNIVFTGVAGAGKTHRLLQIQQCYDEPIKRSWETWRLQHVKQYGWCDVVCAVLLLEDRMMTVPEIMQHALIKDKAQVNNKNDNINQTVWVQLNKHAHPESVTVNTSQRSANYYFDKTESSHWYLLDEMKPSVAQKLSELISFYQADTQKQHITGHVVSRSSLVSFHQSYGYDEFVEGIRPRIDPKTGQMQYAVQDGAFLALCAKAQADPEHRYAMLIDEINRANTAQVFGELMSVIEPSKRAGGETPMSVRLAYSGRQFMVPSNVDIYATMNTQDHSLSPLDMAFRRRFDFIDCLPDSSVVTKVIDRDGNEVNLSKMMDAINQRLLLLLGTEAQLGQSYFMNINDIHTLAKRLYRQIIPQIIEHAKISVAPYQVTEILAQILYGTGIEQVHAQGISLFESNNAIDTHRFQLAAEFIAAANQGANTACLVDTSQVGASQTDANQTSKDHSDSELEQSAYLLAAPYQQLYASS